MKNNNSTKILLTTVLVLASLVAWTRWQSPSFDENKAYSEKFIDLSTDQPEEAPAKVKSQFVSTKISPERKVVNANLITDNYKPIPDFLQKSIKWLAEAQFEDGGWGAGQSSAQHIRDPKAVKTDPATTAFSAMALMRSGNHLQDGPYAVNLQKALEYLLKAVENSNAKSHSITALQHTQPQQKLGQHVDISMTLQMLAKILPDAQYDSKLTARINRAMDQCIAMLEKSQQSDGSWNTGGWAPVLNSAMANNALEYSEAVGKTVKKEVIDRSQQYQAGNYSEGKITSDKAAGIDLYAYSSTQRATAQDAMEVEELIEIKVKETPAAAATLLPAEDEVPEEEATYNVLRESFSEAKARRLAKSYTANKAATQNLKDDAVLSGFGNNGGEEYLSYAMTSESLVATGNEKDWNDWHGKMKDRLAKIQNADGSWSGHHCITSPVFCTAAVVMTLTADRDIDILQAKSGKDQ